MKNKVTISNKRYQKLLATEQRVKELEKDIARMNAGKVPDYGRWTIPQVIRDAMKLGLSNPAIRFPSIQTAIQKDKDWMADFIAKERQTHADLGDRVQPDIKLNVTDNFTPLAHKIQSDMEALEKKAYLRSKGWNYQVVDNTWIHEQTVAKGVDPTTNPMSLDTAFGWQTCYDTVKEGMLQGEPKGEEPRLTVDWKDVEQRVINGKEATEEEYELQKANCLWSVELPDGEFGFSPDNLPVDQVKGCILIGVTLEGNGFEITNEELTNFSRLIIADPTGEQLLYRWVNLPPVAERHYIVPSNITAKPYGIYAAKYVEPAGFKIIDSVCLVAADYYATHTPQFPKEDDEDWEDNEDKKPIRQKPGIEPVLAQMAFINRMDECMLLSHEEYAEIGKLCLLERSERDKSIYDYLLNIMVNHNRKGLRLTNYKDFPHVYMGIYQVGTSGHDLARPTHAKLKHEVLVHANRHFSQVVDAKKDNI